MKNKQEVVYIVVRYHSVSEVFATLADAEDFAQGCGDYKDMKKSEIKSIFPLTQP